MMEVAASKHWYRLVGRVLLDGTRMVLHYYCHSCAASRGDVRSIYTAAPLGTEYQLCKVLKHSVPDPNYPSRYSIHPQLLPMPLSYVIRLLQVQSSTTLMAGEISSGLQVNRLASSSVTVY